jgi:hypothetical protein
MQTWLARMGEAAGRGFPIRPMRTLSQGTRDGQLVRSIHWRWLARRHWSRLARTAVGLVANRPVSSNPWLPLSRASMLTEALWGSTPIITTDVALLPSLLSYRRLGSQGRATLV